MKYLALSTIALFFVLLSCKSKKAPTSTAAATPEPPATTAAPAVSAVQMSIANKRWPNTQAIELADGETIFKTKCTKCHIAYEIGGFSEKKWLHEIDDMSPKARLTPDEKLRLTKHILSYRDMVKPTSQN